MADLVADARNVTYSGQALFVAGGAAVDDGGGGLYIWDAASTAADDGAEIIKPTAIDVGSPGRWKRVDFTVVTHNHLSAQANNAFTSGPLFWTGSQAQYDALTPDANTVYDIVA